MLFTLDRLTWWCGFDGVRPHFSSDVVPNADLTLCVWPEEVPSIPECVGALWESDVSNASLCMTPRTRIRCGPTMTTGVRFEPQVFKSWIKDLNA